MARSTTARTVDPRLFPADLMDLLQPSADSRLFAILDPARDLAILRMLGAAGVDREPLYSCVRGTDFRAVAPQLVGFSDDPHLLQTMLSAGWGGGWGIFLLSRHRLPDLVQHLRRLLTARLPDGRLVYFRFYDPRVMRVFLPTCTAAEARAFFGPVDEYLVEDESAASIHRFALALDGLLWWELLATPPPTSPDTPGIQPQPP